MKIYEAGTRAFENNGLGHIQPLKCIETKKKSLNGWELSCEVELKYKELICTDRIVLVETKEKGEQPFVIQSPQITDVISFTAVHVGFLSERYVLDDVRPTDLIGIDFLNYIGSRTDTKNPFSFYSNVSEHKTKYYVRKTLFEAFEEAEKLFNAVFDFDGFKVNMLTTLDNLSDETLIYGKNMDSIKIYEDWDKVTTKILPVGPDELMLPEKYLVSDVQYPEPYTRVISFTIDKEKEDGTQKSEAELITELRELAKQHLEDNKYPKVNYTVEADIPQQLNIGDIVPVKHPLVEIETSVQEYTYNILTKRVESIVYGNYVRDVKKAFDTIKTDIVSVDKKADNFLIQAKKEVDYLMNVAGKDGTLTFRKNSDGVIYEILCMDTKDIETARTILRINAQGIAGTTEGINGEFKSAMMSNGMVLAEMIAAGTLKAMNIEGGKINGTDIHTDKDLYVGNNIYLNQDDTVSSKKISFGKEVELRFSKSSNVGSFYIIAKDQNGRDISVSFSGGDGILHPGVIINTTNNRGENSIYSFEGGMFTCNGILNVYNDASINGDLTVRGKKNRIVKTSKGMVRMNAIESTFAVFEDFGSAMTDKDGMCTIMFDQLFLETVNTEYDYYVFLSPRKITSVPHICVQKKYKDSFCVHGDPNTKFDWIVIAKQRGYEDVRMEVYKDDNIN